MTRCLQLVFEDCTSFRAEYEQNIVQGGAFVHTNESFTMRESVEVELMLGFCGESIPLDAEVVHAVPEDVGGPEGAGVAVQFTAPAAELRELLESYIYSESGRAGQADPAILDDLENDTIDFQADADGDLLFGTGAVSEAPPETGPEIRARLDAVTAEVGSVAGSTLGGGIAGMIEELGTASLVQMFGTAGASGTLTLVRGDEVGLIGVSAGKLHGVQLGSYRGTKALARMIAWDEGLFHFHAKLDDALSAEEPVAVEGAMLEAIHQLDEVSRSDKAALDPGATLLLDAESLNGRALTTTEEAVVELAEAGVSVGRLVDVIPEPDAEVLDAVRDLIDAGVFALSEDG